MMRSLYSGVTGLRSHQTRMDVIGNNIANVNTIGFKKSTTTFKDLFSQTSSYSSAPTGQIGGINAQQVGLGVAVGDIRMLHTPGAAQYTGNPLDFTIEGDGYFVIRTPETEVFSRAGNFGLDSAGNLVTADGNFVLGYPVDWKQTVPADPTANPPIEDTTYGYAIPQATYDGTTASLQGIKLDADMFYQVSVDQTGAVVAQLRNETKGTDIINAIGVDTSTTTVTDDTMFPRGTKVVVGYLALASFTNPSGLEKLGANNYNRSQNSGTPEIGHPGDAGYGKLIGGSKEMSNVDLSEEVVDMIVTQRGLQANSRIITVSDSILEELINLKR